MSMLRTGAIALVAVVAALVVENQLHRPSQDADLAKQIQELQRAQRELSERSRAPESQQARALAQPASDSARAPERARPDDEDTAAPSEDNARNAEAEPAHTTEEMHSAIEQVFTAERGDSAWSVEAQHRAQDGLTRTLPERSTAVSVRCAESMCRIETRHPSVDDYRHYVEQALVEPTTALWNGGFFSSIVNTSDGGEVTVVSYLAREGQPLPVISRM